MATMTRYEPSSLGMPLREAMAQLFQDSFVAPFGHSWQVIKSVPVDLYETNDAFVVKVSAPGLTADDLTVSIEQQVVTIHGEPKAEESEGFHPVLVERPLGRFTRTFSLPMPVDANKVTAEFTDGVLSLTMPKREAVKPRKIQVKSGT